MSTSLLVLVLGLQSAWADDRFTEKEGALSGVQTHADRSLTLKTELSKLVYLCDPSKYDVITDFTVFKGRLFCSSSYNVDNQFLYSQNGQVLEAERSGEWKVAQDVRGSMLLNLRVAGGRLAYACFSGPTDEVGVYDGSAWAMLAKLPQRMLHGMDVCAYKGKLYWSGALRPLKAEEFEKIPDASKGLGVVFESADEGKTWKEVYRDKEPGRILDMVVMKDKLYANRRGINLMSWDGAAWKEIPVAVPTNPGDKALLGAGLLTVHKDAILAVSTPLYYRFDGTKWTSHTPGFFRLFVDDDRLYGLRADGHVYVSTDGKTWTKLTETGVPPEEFGPDPAKTRTAAPLRRGSLAFHRDRLYVGSGNEGKLFASKFVAKGTYVSGPRSTTGGTKLMWDVHAPAGSTFSISVRSAVTKEQLASAEWREADDTLAVPKEHPFLQYRATFTSEGPYSPVLQRVRWESP
jgi:hypothetical protein